MSLGDLGKILPSDRYIVELSRDVPSSFTKVLTHLYQPLIGIDALCLYQTLHTECMLFFSSDNYQTHHMLMNYIGLPLDRIYRARRKLEAIGLLKTYEFSQPDDKIFRYLLYPPYSASSFFDNDFLSQLLLHEIGKEKFDKLQEAFVKKSNVDESHMVETTAHFKDVFQVKNAAEVNLAEEEHEEEEERIFTGAKIDFDWIGQLLEQRMLPKKAILTASNQKLIEQMAGLYNLTNQEIEKALIWAIAEDNRFNRQEFKEACFDFAKSSNQKVSLKVVDDREKIASKDKDSENKSKEEQFIEMLEHISPKELLQDLTDGATASNQDLKVISEVMTQQGLNPGVMNVLIHYVMLKTDMKLTKSYLEKIASHWARKNVKTVRQAMTLAKSENKKYQQWTFSTSQNRTSYSSNKKDIVPDWYKKQKDEQKQTKLTETEEEKAKKAKEADAMLAEYLRQHANDE
ncbi:replicative DNA helicase loader DnaB [Gracilibacillus ureilyticus]|uniref:Replicative DNA helicase loader DnaB n=1 Tax=Gracilibacillus ureilyticus TaxID=531814 RepID=A0A1H9UEM8_9BACI|nr:DnaD domain protein [Gracilibacillus ureilyticus]SES07906.1 replicative DNA helicase loader DnaB [Gracilibacillus ureilyticus]